MKIIAHRGASGEFPGNSLLALEQAIVQGCDGIEFDVQYHHNSGEFILLHDRHVNFHGKRTHYNKLSLVQLSTIKPIENHNICTLTAALKQISTHCLINIELKSSSQGQQLIEELERLKYDIEQAVMAKIIDPEQIIVSAFNHHALVHTSQLLPKVNIAALIASCPLQYAQFCDALDVATLNLSIDCLNKEIVADAHQRGLKVWVYTVDDEGDIQQCLLYGVDGIFTNFPKRSRNLIRRLRPML